MNFEEAWDYIYRRAVKKSLAMVQDKSELEYVFNLLKDCNSYLEVGTAEGNSLFILAQALPKGAEITYIDWAESHTTPFRNELLEQLTDYKITAIHDNTHNIDNVFKVVPRLVDTVLIDAGHTYEDARQDAVLYGPLAKKYIIFHDIQIPEVNKAFEWYCNLRSDCRTYRVVNSTDFGYGIIEVNNV